MCHHHCHHYKSHFAAIPQTLHLRTACHCRLDCRCHPSGCQLPTTTQPDPEHPPANTERKVHKDEKRAQVHHNRTCLRCCCHRGG
ncbi:hypothetical protein DUNSADRAFT_8079 [Dunaliella salina]|uniref:Encoded protein n=1 Tax=Dunaliella salina TaxID=3046 RepID=A0ABQ7GK31_DUNSA|nr:hypothetical protein DUNSADRAFT_8079 [Dunaliella salina]|eukprot:KAF5834979.1 hypothetical protein DUNSADRAFT_8079 [Dunaliella salina]